MSKKKKTEAKVAAATAEPIVLTKFVARANMWCTTTLDAKGQKQVWSVAKP